MSDRQAWQGAQRLDGEVALGIDVGSSSLKLLLLDRSGTWSLAVADLRLGQVAHAGVVGLTELLERIREALRTLLEELPIDRTRIVTAAVTAHGPSACVLRPDGAPVARLITWQAEASRSLRAEQAAHWPTDLGEGPHALHLAPRGAWPPLRLRQWLAAHPEDRSASLFAVELKDAIVTMLGAPPRADRRSLRGLADEAGGLHAAWSAWLGAPRLSLPPLAAPGEVIGEVDATGVAAGLPRCCQLVMGSCDLSTGLHGLRLSQGQLGLLANSSEHLVVPVDSGWAGSPLVGRGLSLLPAAGLLPASAHAGLASGGRTLEAVLAAFYEAGHGPGAADPAAAAAWLDATIAPATELPADLPPFCPSFDLRRGLDPAAGATPPWPGHPGLAPADLISRHGVPVMLRAMLAGLDDALTPVQRALQPLTDTRLPPRMGGGLVSVRAVLEQRRSSIPGLEVGAGREVSALGTARLAMGTLRGGMAEHA